MKSFFKSLKKHPKTIITIIIISFLAYIMLKLKLDVRAVALITLVMGFITNVFSGISILISTIPIIGPIIVKLFTIPIFWLFNLTGYFSSFIAIKKGYRKTILSHRIVTLTLLLGILIGYILGHLIPVR
tara:strand:+ start:225 stop:611 length:387 start_codon:yes stop_codon:yes gene_type:complete